MASSFVLLILMFLFILVLSALHKTEFIGEGVVMGIAGLLCIPAIITGIIGSVFRALKKD
jgi:hypothetical protein